MTTTIFNLNGENIQFQMHSTNFNVWIWILFISTEICWAVDGRRQNVVRLKYEKPNGFEWKKNYTTSSVNYRKMRRRATNKVWENTRCFQFFSFHFMPTLSLSLDHSCSFTLHTLFCVCGFSTSRNVTNARPLCRLLASSSIQVYRDVCFFLLLLLFLYKLFGILFYFFPFFVVVVVVAVFFYLSVEECVNVNLWCKVKPQSNEERI